MPLPDATRRSPMMHRIGGAALRHRRLILVLSFFVVLTTIAYLVPIVAMVLKILLTSLLVLSLNLITFRGEIVQDLFQRMTHYFAPEHTKTTGSDSSSTRPCPPDL